MSVVPDRLRAPLLVVAFFAVAALAFVAGAYLTGRRDSIGRGDRAASEASPLVVAIDAGAVQLLPDASLRVEWSDLRPPALPIVPTPSVPPPRPPPESSR